MTIYYHHHHPTTTTTSVGKRHFPQGDAADEDEEEDLADLIHDIFDDEDNYDTLSYQNSFFDISSSSNASASTTTSSSSPFIDFNELTNSLITQVTTTTTTTSPEEDSSSTMSQSYSPPIAVLPDSNDVDLRPPRKRRVRRLDNSPFPKIVKTDIRHRLSSMYINVMNSANHLLMESFYKRFCVDCCQVVEALDDYNYHPMLLGMEPIVLNGLSNLVNLTKSIVPFLPDSILQLERSYIIHGLHSPGSKIVMKTKCSATVLKQAFVELQDAENNRHLMPFFMTERLKKAGKVPENCTFHLNPASARNESLEICGDTIFWLDNNNRIYRIEIRGKARVLSNGLMLS
eukprot:scaffold3044_cov176-Ochromonas_danica.AAC.1